MTSTSRTVRRTGSAKQSSYNTKERFRSETALVFARGRVQWSKEGVWSLIRTRWSNLRVRWLGDELPPDVYVGSEVSFVGRIVTANEGRRVMIEGAVPLDGSFREAIDEVMRRLNAGMQDPRDWAERAVLDRLSKGG